MVDAADGDESSVVGPESGVDVFGLVLGLVSVEPLGPVGLPIESSLKSLFKQSAPVPETGPRTIAMVLEKTRLRITGEGRA